MKLLLIAGHGQGDPGACGNGYKEADLVRELLQLLYNRLKNVIDVDIFDTNKNMYKYLKAGNTYNFTKYDYVFELHFNANANTTAHGTEILVHTKRGNVELETKMIKAVANAAGLRNRGVKYRSDLQNMNHVNRKKVNYSLIETCFITNSNDMALYKANMNNVVEAIAKSFINYYNISDKEEIDMNEIKRLENMIAGLNNTANAMNLKMQDMQTHLSSLEKRLQRVEDATVNKFVYGYIDNNMPEWARPTIQKLYNAGYLKGNSNGSLDLDYDMLRILVMLDRSKAFDNK